MNAQFRLWLTLLCAGLIAIAGCSQPPPARLGDREARAEEASVEEAPRVAADQRPRRKANGASLNDSLHWSFELSEESSGRGDLGTSWGETRASRITTTPFVRADDKSAFATGALFYNDEAGARAMASASGATRASEGGVDVGGVITVRLKSEDGTFLSGFDAGESTFVAGHAGDRYSIVLQSRAPARLEAVVSVDGLDVMDGKAASFGKRGYLIDPNGSVEIDGFRQSLETVAAFRFGSVQDSYVQRTTGSSRNVGVIGIALFNEEGTNPSTWPRHETQKRLDANPFPGQWATPP